MPVLNFGTSIEDAGIQTEVGTVSLARVIGKAQTRSGIQVSVILAGRLRGPADPLILQTQGDAIADLKRRLRLATTQISSGIRTLVQYFVDATATPAPFGRLLMPTIDQITNPNASPRGFNGARFVRGDSVAIEFTIQGQRLDGYLAQFHACRSDQPIGSPHEIDKAAPSSIRQTEPVRDSQTCLETFTGIIQLDPSDTANLPDGEVEFIFEFKVDDGNGRVHTLESGKFKIYSVC